MSGIEAAGFFIGLVSVGFSALSFADFRSAYAPPVTDFVERVREDGLFMTILLRTVLTDALSVMERVERYVVYADDAHALAFMKSYTSSFNMIGVAVSSISTMSVALIDFGRVRL